MAFLKGGLSGINLKTIRFNSLILFLIILAGVLVLDVMVIKESAGVVLSLGKQDVKPVESSNGVRVNFTDYQKIVDKIEQSKNFKPSTESVPNPFRTVVK